MGRSFHWMDQETVLDQLHGLIKVGGGLVIIGNEPVEQESEAIKWEKAVKETVTKYLGPERRAGSKIYSHPEKSYEDLLPNSKFKNYQEHYYTFEVGRNIDETIGNLFSMSWAIKSHFGDKIVAFEAELRQKLEAASLGGNYSKKIRFGMYTITK